MSTSNTYGWEKLRCPYFTSICRSVLSDYLLSQGFVEKELTPQGGVVYRKIDIFLEICYETETFPNYSPTVVLGIGRRTYDVEGLGAVPLWYVVPDDLLEFDYTSWRFSSESDLESVLTRIKDSILTQYARPLWNDREQLEAYIKRFQAQVASQIAETARADGIRMANKAWKAQDYAQAIELYEKYLEYLTKLELARLEYARKKIASSS